MNNNGNPQIVPFGKYKGQPLDVLANDPNYVEWLNGQGWVKDKYPQFYTVIINNFQEPSDTPEHNALQVLFLDDEFCMQVIYMLATRIKICVYGIDNRFLLKGVSREFEVNGVDVILHYAIWELHRFEKYTGDPNSHLEWIPSKRDCGIEIKPSLGDDFPSVLRQAQRMRGETRCVVFRDFVATSVTLEQVRAMFKHSGVLLFSLDEIRQAHGRIYPDTPELPS